MQWSGHCLIILLGGNCRTDISEDCQISNMPYFNVEGVEENCRLDCVMTGNCGNPGGTLLIGGLQACTNVHKRARMRAHHLSLWWGEREDSKEDAMLMSLTPDLLRYFLPCLSVIYPC